MSGNPFRASPSVSHNQAAAPPISFPNADSSRADAIAHENDAGNASPLPPVRTKKSVRIESPPSSPPHPVVYDEDDALPQRSSRGRYADSSPLTHPAPFPNSFEDHTAAESSHSDHRGDDAYEGRHITHKGGSNSDMVGAVQSPIGAPANPFSRTLATIEPQEDGSTEVAGQRRVDRTAAEKARANAVRGSLDVEGFKKLLMTGISGPTRPSQLSQPMAAPNPVSASILESSSSTSSISRQSVFEPVQESHAESPRTSYEMALSDDDRVGLMVDSKKSEKKKPLPPKPRHGRPLSVRAPQTVSFSDFSATEIVASSPVSRSRANSDLNKPLPEPPVKSQPVQIISRDTTEDGLAPLEPSNLDLHSYPENASTQKKAPPPVPLARRHSQLRTSTHNRSRSNSALTISSQHSAELSLPSPSIGYEPTSSPSSKAPPPPPPARRHGASLTGNHTPSTNSSNTELPLTATSRPAVASPNVPTSRRTALSSQPPASPVLGSTGLSRNSSVASNRHVPRSVSNESVGSNMPPPPPPPRRRQSGRSSLDKERPYPLPISSPTESRRPSAEYKRNSMDSKRRTSVASESSLRHEYAPSAENENALYSPKEEVSQEHLQTLTHSSSTILDDMEQFQKEIDALRDRYKTSA